MTGSVFFAVLVAVVMFVLAVFMSPLFIIPAVVVVLVALFSAPLLAAIGRGGGRDAGGTPTTSEASYEPVAPPTERTA